MTREAPRRLSGALGEALVVVRLAKQAVAVPVGARCIAAAARDCPGPAANYFSLPIILAQHLSHD